MCDHYCLTRSTSNVTTTKLSRLARNNGVVHTDALKRPPDKKILTGKSIWVLYYYFDKFSNV